MLHSHSKNPTYAGCLFWAAIGQGLMGCQEHKVTAFNSEPVATITSHTEGDQLVEGTAETFSGMVNDDDDRVDELTTTWRIGDRDVCSDVVPNLDGVTTCEITLLGEDIPADDDAVSVSLTVSDPRSANHTARVVLDPEPNLPPEIEILSPIDGQHYYADETITFHGTVSDAEDHETDLSVWWESSLEGALSFETDITDEGTVINTGFLGVGQHTLSLMAEDSGGARTVESVNVLVKTENSPPSCAISTPTDDQVFEHNTTIAFAGVATDPDVTPGELSVLWESDRDGILNESPPLSDGTMDFAIETLTAGDHRVHLSVSDERDLACTASVLISVRKPPTIESFSPEDGSIVTQGQEVTLSAVVNDHEDDPPEGLLVEWTSDLHAEAPLGEATTNAMGNAAIDVIDLVPGDHLVTITVTDSDGMSGSSYLALVVNQPPTRPEISLSPDPAATVDDLVTNIDVQSIDPEGETVSYRYSWSRDGEESLLSTSDLFPSEGTAKGQRWTITVTPNDGETDGPSGTASVDVLNTPPVLARVEISPNRPSTTDTITCTATDTSDEDGDSVSISHRWRVNDVEVDVTGSSIGPALFSAADRVHCEAIPRDDEEDGVSVRSETVQVNSPPTIATANITPSDPTGDQDLTCVAGTASDIDGDEVVAHYRWFVDDIELGEDANTLASGFFERDQTVSCAVTPHDGIESGSTVHSTSVTINNSAPGIERVDISPSEPLTTDALTCTASGTADSDGDSVTIQLRWLINDEYIETMGSALPPSAFDSGDVIVCEAIPNDGTDSGDATRSARTHINVLPTIGAVTISPAAPTGSDDLTCGHGPTSDLDGDAVDVHFRWYVNETELAITEETLPASFIRRDDEVVCWAVPNDGREDGLSRASEPLTVQNATPAITGISLLPGAPTTTDTLECTATETSDGDGDPVDVEYRWFVNGDEVAADSHTLSPDHHEPGDTVHCEGVPSDDTTTGDAIESASVKINVPPTIGEVSVSPSEPTGASDLVCNHGPTSDLDGHTVDVGFRWYVNDIELDETTDTLVSTYITRDDEVRCSATPHDGLEAGEERTSDLTTVLNAPPTVATIEVAPDAPKTSDVLDCAYTDAADADGDVVGVDLVWIINGETTDFTGASLEPDHHAPGDSIACEGTPNDGTAAGDAVRSSSVKINTPPTVGMAYISPADPSGADELTCNYSEPSDLDGHAVTLRYRWFVGGIEIGETSGTLSSSFFVRDTLVQCAVVPNDGLEDGADVFADEIVILNAPPTISTVEISPDDPMTTDTLTCDVVGIEDGDGDPVDVIYVWTVDGEVSGETSETLTPASFEPGNVIGCTATPTDGTDSGPTLTADVVQVNNLPTILAVNIAPTDATVLDALTCTETLASDIDGDDVSSSIRWLLNGVATDVTGDTLSEGYRRGDTVRCEVTPFDGREYGEPTHAEIEIQNSPPEVDDLVITPTVPSTDSALVASATVTDADVLDAPSIAYAWRVNGEDVGVSGATLDGTVHFDRGDEVQAVATATDGSAESEPLFSEIITIGNSPPTAPEISISPIEPAAGAQDLVCAIVTPSSDDDDDDTIEYVFAWTVDGEAYEYAESWGGYPGDTVPGFATSGEEVWTCTVTATDGEASATSDSASAIPIVKFVGWGGDPVEIDDWSTTLYGENNGEKAGTALANAGDLNGDGMPDILVGAPYYKNGSTSSAGRAYLALSDGSSPYLSDAHRIYESTKQSLFGYSLSGQSNVGGTSLPDVAIGAPQYDYPDNAQGIVAVYFDGGPDVGGPLGVGDADVLLVGEANGDQAGFDVSFVPDMDADGAPELLVGAPFQDDGGTNAGAGYLVPSSLLLTSDEIDLSHVDVKLIEGESGKDRAGSQVKVAGDIDGDGITELLIGATHWGGAYAGRAYVVNGDDVISAPILVDLENADHIFQGETAHDKAGTAIDGNFDADGDGTVDILIGAPHPVEDDMDDDLDYHPAGRAYLIFGRSLPGIDTLGLAGANVVIECDTDNCERTDTQQSLGASVSGASDVDADGFSDLLIGVPNYKTSHKQAGTVALFFGSSVTDGGVFGLSDADAVFHGQGTNHYAGSAVVGMGDIDGDSWEDFAVGERGDGTVVSNGGLVHILLSPGS